jgi:hypothetical protein
VELEQCCRLDERAKLRNPAWAHEQRGQSEHEAIERGQIRRALPGSIADQKLMFEQKRFRGDGAYTTWAKQLREGDQQVDGADEEFAHGANRSMTVGVCKTAPHGPVSLILRIRHPQVAVECWDGFGAAATVVSADGCVGLGPSASAARHWCRECDAEA